jgi:hypothetical protein
MLAEKSFNRPKQKTTENQMTNRDLRIIAFLSKRKSKQVKLFLESSFNSKNFQRFVKYLILISLINIML